MNVTLWLVIARSSEIVAAFSREIDAWDYYVRVLDPSKTRYDVDYIIVRSDEVTIHNYYQGDNFGGLHP